MPKINVYLPDELAEAVKDTGIPVSAVCQRALEQAVRRITAIRESTADTFDPEDPTALVSFTPRARSAIKHAQRLAAAENGAVITTRHLLDGVLAEEGNLALRVLDVLEVAPATVRQELARRGGESGREPGGPAFSTAAANALEMTTTEATGLGHNYIGCEHLLLGMISEPEGTAGRTLRALGAEYRLARRAVNAALAGYVHLRAQTAAAAPGAAAAGAGALAEVVKRELAPLVERLERLERQVGPEPGATR
ncbi:Clp protease N-terminal domain-containing protein [Streptomyces sp. MP131-18]|uniref:Clp protease N-terminal domain-containing protein n=1 Tax=Streptomyces sp. MP131-18 TaxID=1857892 RepID=UPI00097C66C8|nr:Clp protease N-terminal domain-containing protein [Streptomyces sp. MP131-18]ONK10689.1 putative ATP-dependent Clp protease ATP-binding subunit [Streptomyces sp. MP131-18]